MSAANLHLHPSTPPALGQALRDAALNIVDDGNSPVLVPFAELSEVPPDRAAIAFHHGKLGEAHAAALLRPSPALLLALREDGVPSAWELAALRSFLSGAPLLEMLPPPISAWRVACVTELKAVTELASRAAEAAGARAAGGHRAADVMYELIANAMFDAPALPDGSPKYAHRRAETTAVAPEDACRAAFSSVPGRLYLSATDLFGRLAVEPLAKAVAGVGEPAKVDASGGGAGLGMKRLVENSELFAARVTRGVLAEVVCVVDLGDTRRRTASPKSLFFTTVGG